MLSTLSGESGRDFIPATGVIIRRCVYGSRRATVVSIDRRQGVRDTIELVLTGLEEEKSLAFFWHAGIGPARTCI